MIGTMDGVATVHVYSANPKTADGYNTLIFRRTIDRSLKKLSWASTVDATNNPLPEDIVLRDERLEYTREQKKRLIGFLVGHLKKQYGVVENDDFGRFHLQRIFAKEVQRHALATRREYVAALSARQVAERMVHLVAAPNEELNSVNGIHHFEYGLAKVRIGTDVYLAMGIVGIRQGSAPYYDQHTVAKFKADSEASSIQGHMRIGESAFEQIYDNRFRLILQGVELYDLQRDGHAAYGMKNSIPFVQKWLEGKRSVALVTGRTSFAKCGAETFLSELLQGKDVTHLRTVGENARLEDVEEKRKQLPAQVDAFIAAGGGTVIDTAKLLRGFSGVPFLAVPTTAGTGAETTRFAVYYDHGRKCSADDVRYLPTDQVLIPEFCDSASAYQKASCAFDAYAQAVESLWAKGATEESKGYARKALELMKDGRQLQGSYWAGRAIDISRTTAAHAFSYYMTANYGVPHGEAVYMMFPYICRANGHEEFIREMPELRTLRSFAADNGIRWDELIDRLFENVNPARLGNNPCEVRKEHFNG